MMLRGLLLFACLAAEGVNASPVCVVDDRQREVCLQQPAQRIVSLSPGITELLFEIGAGESVVGTSTYTDFPSAAAAIDEIGSYQRLDLEAITARQPDLLIAWVSGSPTGQVEQLEAMGVTVYWSEIRQLAGIADTLRRFGRLTGRFEAASSNARLLEAGLLQLRRQYADAQAVTVFYQVWDSPLMTVNGEHLISQAIELCGGQNIFADLPRLTPRIDREAVIAGDPEVLMTSGDGEDVSPDWRVYSQMQAVRNGYLIEVPGTLSRATSRSLLALEAMCASLASVRGGDDL